MNSYLASFGPALANHLWQSTAFAAAAWLLTILLRKNSARVRYGVWLAASIKFLIPFSLLIALGGLLPKPAQPVAPAVYAAMKVTEQPFADISAGSITSPVQTLTLTQRIAADIPAILVVLWLVGTLTVLLIWFQRWRKASVCLHEAVPASHGRELEILRRLEARVGNGRRSPLRLRLSVEPSEPSIFGIFRSVFVWPQRLSERLEDEHIEAIMVHELAHARRFDNATAALHMLVEALFWFHPLVWWMERRMIEERERACDESVVALGGSPDTYAEGILKTCRFCVGSALSCVAGVTGADLKKRVVDIVTVHTLIRVTWRKKLLIGAAALCAVTAPILLGQLQDSTATIDSGFTFDVSSVKPNKSGKWSPLPSGPGRFSSSNTTLRALIQWAYHVHDFQLSGGPSWINSDRFDIEAETDRSEAVALQKLTPVQQALEKKQMLQTVLVDRFKLRLHHEMKELPIDSLVVVKAGRIPEDDGDCGSLGGAPPNPPLPPVPANAIGSASCGGVWMAPGHLGGRRVPITTLVDFLPNVTQRIVINKTNLIGEFDINLAWTPDDPRPGGYPGLPHQFIPDPDGPSLSTALEEQLGLKLESGKGPVDVLVIDSVEKPLPN